MKLILIVLWGLSFVAVPALAQTDEQKKLTACNKQAADKGLIGDKQRQFVSTCMKGGPAAKGGAAAAKGNEGLTPQQVKLKDCNKQATDKGLIAEKRRQFMSSCMK